MGDTYIETVTFSVVRDGVEEVIPGKMYLGWNAKMMRPLSDKDHKLSYRPIMAAFPEWTDMSIHVDHPWTNAMFIHPNNTPGENLGCGTLTAKEPYWATVGEGEYAENVVWFNNTVQELKNVRQMYVNANEEGELTGDKFILRTNSVAEMKVEKLESKKAQKIETNVETPDEISF